MCNLHVKKRRLQVMLKNSYENELTDKKNTKAVSKKCMSSAVHTYIER